MSELEIQKRQEYKRNRKKWTIIQAVALALVIAIALGSFFIYERMNRTYYIEYTESSNIDYKVQYKENEFFKDEWIGKDQAYIASLISNIAADFDYTLNMDASNIGFDYNYAIDAKLVVADKDTGDAYYTIDENLIPRTQMSAARSKSVTVHDQVSIDYVKFNNIATAFVTTYNLKNSSSTLVVTLNVEVLSSCDEFEKNNENSYSTSINIPLAAETFSVEISSSVPESESKVLAYRGSINQKIFFTLGVVFSAVSLVLMLLLFAFLHLTRNEDITYAARVRKLVKSYGSFIQRINGDFDDTGYQIVTVNSFNGMLGIRDTIQSPVLMSENRDETMTRFLIPTNTQILYVYEIKVDNYDEIYSRYEEPIESDKTVISGETEDAIILTDNFDVDEITEAMAQPDVVLSEIEYVKDDDDQFEVAPEDPGIEVIGVVWPERSRRNKVYRYDPNGEVLHEGDVVLVPTRDAARDREVIRKAAVAHENHRVAPEHITHPLKQIIGVIKRKVESALTPSGEGEDNTNNQ